MADITVTGLKELNNLLQRLPVQIEKNILRGATREGAKTILAEAVHRAPARSAALVASLKVGTRAKGGTVTAYVKTNLFYSRFVEFGTRPHEIRPRYATSLFLAGIFSKVVQHPGSRPRPFLRPALDAAASAAVVSVAEYIKKRLATKHDMETAHIMVEGDEP